MLLQIIKYDEILKKFAFLDDKGLLWVIIQISELNVYGKNRTINKERFCLIHSAKPE